MSHRGKIPDALESLSLNPGYKKSPNTAQEVEARALIIVDYRIVRKMTPTPSVEDALRQVAARHKKHIDIVRYLIDGKDKRASTRTKEIEKDNNRSDPR